MAKIAWPKSPHGSGLGTKRWIVERTIAWLHQYRRLRIRYERRNDIHEALLAIGCSLICLKLLQAEESSGQPRMGLASFHARPEPRGSVASDSGV